MANRWHRIVRFPITTNIYNVKLFYLLWVATGGFCWGTQSGTLFRLSAWGRLLAVVDDLGLCSWLKPDWPGLRVDGSVSYLGSFRLASLWTGETWFDDFGLACLEFTCIGLEFRGLLSCRGLGENICLVSQVWLASSGLPGKKTIPTYFLLRVLHVRQAYHFWVSDRQAHAS